LWLSTTLSVIHTEIKVLAQVAAEERIVGVPYGPFRDGQSPDLGIFPTLAQIQADMPLLKRMGNVIRFYSVTNNFDQIIGLAKQAGLKAIPTAWIGTNDTANHAEIAKLISITPQYDNIPFVIVGSEAILCEDKTPARMMAYLNQV
jgi:exo-beta-1,3-glucanase (GH17 family)